MKHAWWLVLAGGCNWIYGLDETRNRDAQTAQFFDAPVDAPFGCPADGIAPRFKSSLRQVPVTSCQWYVPSETSGNAVAYCTTLGIAEGPIDGVLATAIPSTESLFEPRLFPEGDRMFVKNFGNAMLEIWSKSGGAWTRTSMQPIPANVDISNPSRGPDRRVVTIDYDTAAANYKLTEYTVDADGILQPRDAYRLETAPNALHPSLSGDGLRLVFDTFGGPTYYASRPDLTSRFVTIQPLGTPKGTTHSFLSEDCGKLYFAALDTVLWLQQE